MPPRRFNCFLYLCGVVVLLASMTYMYTQQLHQLAVTVSGDSRLLNVRYSLNTTDRGGNLQYQDLLRCQDLRLKRLRHQCLNHRLATNLTNFSSRNMETILNRFLVDDTHGVILKSIPKSGCSSWKTILILNSMTVDNTTKINPHDWKSIKDYNLKILQYKNYTPKLYHYFLILTVRHPLARLESGFRDKVLYVSNITSDIEAVFQTFLDSIINHPRGKKMNAHWRPFTWHTNPCAVPFDFITKTETAAMDMDYIIHQKLAGKGQAIHRNDKTQWYNQSQPTFSRDETVLPLFSSLADPEKTITRLMRKYGLDMKLFGYGYKVVNGKVIAFCETDGHNAGCC